MKPQGADASGTETWRREIYAGQLREAPPSPSSRKVSTHVQHSIMQALGSQHLFDIGHPVLRQAGSYEALAPVRQWLKESDESKRIVGAWLSDLLGDVAAYAIDYPRLRMLPSVTSPTPAGQAMYLPHRDVWYGNSASQINIWLPLHDIIPAQSFAFYPSYYQTAIDNSSAEFDYTRWMTHTGWQEKARGTAVSAYPHTTVDLSSTPIQRFALPEAASVCFSAQHLHATQQNPLLHPRMSIDIRCVHRADQRLGIGAPNVDNRSLGDATLDYRFLEMHPAAAVGVA